LHSKQRSIFGGAGFAVGFVASILAGLGGAALAALVGWSERPVITFVLLATAVALVSAVTTVAGALGTVSVAWGGYSGFVVHQYGELRWTSTDRHALVVFLGLAITTSVVCAVGRLWLTRTRSVAPDVIPAWLDPAIPEVSGHVMAEPGRAS
jgi:hypothetical protein